MKPRFVDDMKNITVEVGQDATFVCVVSEIHVSNSTVWNVLEHSNDCRATEWAGSRQTAKPSRQLAPTSSHTMKGSPSLTTSPGGSGCFTSPRPSWRMQGRTCASSTRSRWSPPLGSSTSSSSPTSWTWRAPGQSPRGETWGESSWLGL